ncbi:MAG: hypothetical protein HGA61_04810 [Candidatus Moranbacteria bacterium]|nr:hypothetical protein [Candidatus Moranbacteria bacterium]
MTNQTKNNSFTENSKQPEILDEFAMRTMQDDLANMNSTIGDEKKYSQNSPLQSEMINHSNPSQSPFETSYQENKQKERLTAIPQSKSTKPSIANSIKNSNGNTRYKIMFSIIIFVIIVITGLGYLYYRHISATPVQEKTASNSPSVDIKTAELPKKETTVVEPIIEKYSATKPNFFSIDPATISVEDIKSQLLKISDEIKIPAQSIPYEFLVVDKNNNPISLKSFTEITKINLSTSVFNKLSSDFSIYIFNDKGNARLGLKIKTVGNDKASLLSEIIKQENTLVEDLNFIFLNTPTNNNRSSFTVSDYTFNNTIIRYLNVNNDKTLSIDYTVTDNELIIGTSKETLRKIYTKIQDQSNPTVENSN